MFLPPKSMARAIPGGKYGCAQYLKCCGQEIFRKCSLGKLSLLAQEAITRGFLVYHKTLLVKSANLQINLDLNSIIEIQNETNIQEEVKLDPEKK